MLVITEKNESYEKSAKRVENYVNSEKDLFLCLFLKL